ncbi:MAG: hypothetical protein Kow0080_32480 [Candidatus Promineifilaceae bacterium]
MAFSQPDFNFLRQQMVKVQLEERGIYDQAVLKAMGTIPRERFVLPAYRDQAYRDGPLPLPANQTISQPYVVAMMLQLLELKPENKVLEVGTGSGYAAAVLGKIVAAVHTIERHPELVTYARERLKQLGITNVIVYEGDGTLGLPEEAPFDGIVVAAGGPEVPPALLAQLTVNGRLVMPVGREQRRQRMIKVTKLANGRFRRQNLGPVAFVPLIGKQGWENKDN